jgi:hypothetical protein
VIPVSQTPSPDVLKTVLRRVFEAPEYDWGVRRDPLALVTQLLGRVRGWLQELEDAHPIAFAILVIALTLLLVLILVHLAYLAWRALHPEPVRAAGATAAATEARDAHWHLVRSRYLAEVGRYREAMAHRFVALLLQLDDRSVLTFRLSKTPAEYLREARLAESDRDTFSRLISDLYRHLFGGVPCHLVSLNDWWWPPSWESARRPAETSSTSDGRRCSRAPMVRRG